MFVDWLRVILANILIALDTPVPAPMRYVPAPMRYVPAPMRWQP